jgi:Zn-dependent protease with chaperone function
MEPPELYVRQNPTPNAYTLAISGRKPFIVVHTSLLELLTPRELQAVLAHGEQSKHLHGWRPLANSSAISFAFALPFVPHAW